MVKLDVTARDLIIDADGQKIVADSTTIHFDLSIEQAEQLVREIQRAIAFAKTKGDATLTLPNAP